MQFRITLLSYFQLNQIDLLELVVVLMTYLMKYLFQTKQKI